MTAPAPRRLAAALRSALGRSSRGGRLAYELVEALPPAGGKEADLVYRRRETRARAQPLVAPRDAADAFVAVSMAALARIAGPQAWGAWCDRLAASPIRRARSDAANLRAGLAAARGAAVGTDEATTLAAAVRAGYFRQQMLYAIEAAGRFAPAIDFAAEDRARLTDALGRGRGAILWVDETFAGPLVSKRGLAEAGFRASHVSSHLHGVSLTRFGAAALNPRIVRAENRHLAERLVFEGGETAEVMRRTLRALKAGGVVTMTNGLFSGAGFVETPFGAGGWLSVSTGALGLALRHGAALFPLAAIEVEPFAAYRIELAPRIAPPPGGGSNAALAAAARAAGEGLRARVAAWPDQYPGLIGGRFSASRFPEMRSLGGKVGLEHG